MTAYEARAITKDLEKLTFFEHLREIWICGKINEAIEKAARKGEICIKVKFSSDFSVRIHKRIIQYYENMGFDTHVYKYYRTDRDPIYVGIGWKNI